MSDLEREKYVRLMSEIEALEGEIHALEGAATSGDAAVVGDHGSRLAALRERLGERMRELARVTDGCTRPRAMR